MERELVCVDSAVLTVATKTLTSRQPLSTTMTQPVRYSSITDIDDEDDGEEEVVLRPTSSFDGQYQPPGLPEQTAANILPPKARSSLFNNGHERESQLENLTRLEFYRQDNWFEELCEILFKIRKRGTTISSEVYYGVIHFISCLYCLAVIPQQLYAAGYQGRPTVVSVALCTGAGSILSGLFANLPFVLAPPTVVSIFLSVFLQQKEEGPNTGSIAVVLSGLLLMLFGWRPLGTLTANLIPLPIQVGTAVGIGILTALAGSTEVQLVEPGSYTILKIGEITPMICLSFAGVVLICIGMRLHWKGSFCIAVILCSIIWWWYDNSFPDAIAAFPNVHKASWDGIKARTTPLLTIDLLFLYVLYLNGLMTSLSNLAVLTREDSTIPRGRWIYIICGIFTVFAGLLQSAPVLVSPESSASIKEGAKTGLSAVVAGVLFLVALFFSPVFEMVPPPGTSPVLVMIGVILFQNVSRIDWRNVKYAAPAFVVLFYIPFTYSIIQGVLLGYIVYLAVSLFTGELPSDGLFFVTYYFPQWEDAYVRFFGLHDSRAQLASESRRNSTNKPMNTANGRTASLFDDDSKHLLVADMGFSGHSECNLPVNAADSADFGTAFRQTLISKDGSRKSSQDSVKEGSSRNSVSYVLDV